MSAYRSDSHAAWSDWLVESMTGFDWQRLELPGRFFSWRIRGNPLSWLDRLPSHPPDLVVASSMVDLATLRGLHPRIARVPCVYYFHENQFAYPISGRQIDSIGPQMVQLYGALAAQRLLFNSRYNKDSFLSGVGALLDRFPDHVPNGVVERLKSKSSVLPVPIRWSTDIRAKRDPSLILWNHRWEYDKAPEVFVDAVLRLAATGNDFHLALLGPRPERTMPALAQLRTKLGGRIVADAKLPLDEYRRWLSKAGIAVSTAIHEFQGLSMLEAVSAGASPLVPDALCYPEQYPAEYRYPAGNAAALAARLIEWITTGAPPAPNVSAWQDSSLSTTWRQMLGSGFVRDHSRD